MIRLFEASAQSSTRPDADRFRQAVATVKQNFLSNTQPDDKDVISAAEIESNKTDCARAERDLKIYETKKVTLNNKLDAKRKEAEHIQNEISANDELLRKGRLFQERSQRIKLQITTKSNTSNVRLQPQDTLMELLEALNAAASPAAPPAEVPLPQDPDDAKPEAADAAMVDTDGKDRQGTDTELTAEAREAAQKIADKEWAELESLSIEEAEAFLQKQEDERLAAQAQMAREQELRAQHELQLKQQEEQRIQQEAAQRAQQEAQRVQQEAEQLAETHARIAAQRERLRNKRQSDSSQDQQAEDHLAHKQKQAKLLAEKEAAAAAATLAAASAGSTGAAQTLLEPNPTAPIAPTSVTTKTQPKKKKKKS